MARGWESKSVGAQQAEARLKAVPSQPKLTPAQIQQKRQLDALSLARNRVLQQLTSTRDPRHQEMLRLALADLDAKIRALTPHS